MIGIQHYLVVSALLFVTGSSDDHGADTGHRIGCNSTSDAAYDALLAQVTSDVRPLAG